MTINESTPVQKVSNSPTRNDLKILLSKQGIEFIESAYLSILKRQVDESGLNHYHGLLLTGTPKIKILEKLLNSSEARALANTSECYWIKKEVKLQRFSEIPFIGMFFSMLYNTEGKRSSDHRLRSVEQKLFQIEKSVNHNLGQLDYKMTEYKQLMKSQNDYNQRLKQRRRNEHIFIDVTTLMKWTRPPVGIVRVLLELVRFSLENPSIGFFHFNTARDDIKLIDREIIEDLIERLSNIKDHIETRAGSEFFQDLQEMLNFQSTTEVSENSFMPFNDKKLTSLLSPEILIADNMKSIFKRNDTVISIGLDWDNSNYPILYWLKKRIGFKFVGAFYDGIPVVSPEMLPSIQFSQMFFLHVCNLVNLSDKIFSISKFSEKQLRTIIHQQDMRDDLKIKTIYLGDAIEDLNNDCHEVRKRRAHSELYAIYVSTIETRKNHKLLLEIWRKMIDAKMSGIPDLVCVGMWGWGTEELRECYFSDSDLQRHIHFYDDVDDNELAMLYKKANFSVFPSFMEGWGLGAVESMAHGVPALISTAPALTEATQGLMPTADPYQAQQWVALIEKFLYEEGYADSLREKIRENFVLKNWREFSSDFYSFIMEDIK